MATANKNRRLAAVRNPDARSSILDAVKRLTGWKAAASPTTS
jgi:hypothetical protein